MAAQKYLSQKRTAQQTISLSPALKEWLQRSVRVYNREAPENERFKRVSAFASYAIEKALTELKTRSEERYKTSRA